MRILHVTYAFPPTHNIADGITNVVYHVTRELARRGHEVAVYAPNAWNLSSRKRIKQKELVDNNLHVQYMNYICRSGTFFFTPSIIHLLRCNINNFDIVHIHDARSFQGIVAFLSSNMHKVPFVFQPHGSYLSPLPSTLFKRLARASLDRFISDRIVRKAACVLALTRDEARQYEKVGIPRKRIALVPNGIDVSYYSSLPTRGSFRRRLNISDRQKVILFLGRIHEIKGIDTLVRAYAYLLNNLGYGEARLVIVGPDDGYLGKLRKLIGALRFEIEPLILGPLYGMDKLEAYVDADVYVLPSRYEAWGITILEAYACGKPVVASRVGGLKDLVTNNVTGLLVEPGDVTALANSILAVLTDGNMATRMRSKGRQLIEENFSVEKVADRLETIYRDHI